MNILKIITLSLLTMSLAFAGEAENKTAKPSVIDALYDKFVADNSKDVEKSYDAYLKSLESTNKKVIAALEAVKKDMNDPKKGKLTIQERAAAISEIDEKITKVKEGSVGEGLVSKRGQPIDLLGNVKVDLSKAIVGKWKYTLKASAGLLIIDTKGNVTHPQGFTGKVQSTDEKTEIVWSNNTKWDIAMREDGIYITDNAGDCKLVK